VGIFYIFLKIYMIESKIRREMIRFGRNRKI